MARDPRDEEKPGNRDQKLPPVQTPPGQQTPGGREPDLQPAEEWGERLDHGKDVARGGKEDGHVPGAEPSS